MQVVFSVAIIIMSVVLVHGRWRSRKAIEEENFLAREWKER
jgi:hypothetical protein